MQSRTGILARVFATFMAVAVVTVLGATAEAQQLQKSGKYTGKFGNQAVGQTYELEKGHVFFVGMFYGVFFNDVADGFLDKTDVTCPGVNDVVGGVAAANHGYCIMTDKDGDKAFLVWQGKGSGPGSNGGTFQWTGGTGKFLGIQGNNTWRGAFIANMGGAVVWEGEWRLP
jgi:hypothetical protein